MDRRRVRRRGVVRLLLWLAFYAAPRVDDRENARTAIAGRANQQHAWVLADDERGTFGDYPPAV